MPVEIIVITVGDRVKVRTDVGFVPLAGKVGEVTRVDADGPMPISVKFVGIVVNGLGAPSDMTLCYRRDEIEVL